MPSSGASTEGEKRSVGVSATGVAMDTLRFVDGEPGLELGIGSDIGQKAPEEPGMMRSPKFQKGSRRAEAAFGDYVWLPPLFEEKGVFVSVSGLPARLIKKLYINSTFENRCGNV